MAHIQGMVYYETQMNIERYNIHVVAYLSNTIFHKCFCHFMHITCDDVMSFYIVKLLYKLFFYVSLYFLCYFMLYFAFSAGIHTQ